MFPSTQTAGNQPLDKLFGRHWIRPAVHKVVVQVNRHVVVIPVECAGRYPGVGREFMELFKGDVGHQM